MTVGPVIPYKEHLLPTSSSELMQSLSAADGERITGMPVPIDTIKTPQITPSSFLPFLG